MSATTRVALHNPHAGLAWRSSRTRRALDALRALPGTALVPTRRGEITAQTRDLLTPGVTSVFAVGGDGTVSDVAAGLQGTDVALGIIPGGSTNTLAYEFGIPKSPLHAVRALTSPGVRTRRLRTWCVGDRHLVLGVGVGWDARLMYRTPDALKRSLGYFAFTPIGVVLGLTYDFPQLTIEGTDSNGRLVSSSGTSVLVSNARHWAGPRAVFPDADPASDLLEVIVLENRSRLELINFWLNMMLPGGRPLAADGVQVLKLRSVSITSDRPVEVHVNGDPAGPTPVRVVPGGCVTVLAP